MKKLFRLKRKFLYPNTHNDINHYKWIHLHIDLQHIILLLFSFRGEDGKEDQPSYNFISSQLSISSRAKRLCNSIMFKSKSRHRIYPSRARHTYVSIYIYIHICIS